MAASGAAFRLTWDTASWNDGNVDVIFTYDDPAKIYRTGLEALGCGYNMLSRTAETKKSEFVDFIKSRIDEGIPCIALGIIGPPEACIITGYRDGGETLLGWNFFQDNPEFAKNIEFDECGYFITDKWWENRETLGVMALGKDAKPAFTPETVQKIAVEVMTGRMWKSFAKGVDAYDAWAKAVTNNSDFPENAILPILVSRIMSHGDAMDCVTDGRHNAAEYFKNLVAAYPENAKKLEEIAALFRQAAEIHAKMSALLGGWERGEKEMRNFAKPEVRKALADIIYETRDADKKALEIIAGL
jgi:hypothetical protein